jgi:hypothetical protein
MLVGVLVGDWRNAHRAIKKLLTELLQVLIPYFPPRTVRELPAVVNNSG